jgi:hypothetical protein
MLLFRCLFSLWLFQLDNFGLLAENRITEPTVVTTAIIDINGVVTDESCAGNGNGEINITASNGTSPYTYAWSNGSSAEDLTNLTPGDLL